MNTLTTTKARMMIDPIFRRFIIIDILDTFTIGIAAAVLPLFIIEKFGRSSELAWTTALLILPKVFSAPTIGHVSLKEETATKVGIALVIVAISFLYLPLTLYYRIFQGAIALRSIVGIASSISMFTSQQEPSSKTKNKRKSQTQKENISTNATMEIISKGIHILAPTSVGLGLWFLSIPQCFYITCCLLLLDLMLIITGGLPLPIVAISDTPKETLPYSYNTLLRLFRKNFFLSVIFIPFLGYSMLFGALRLFLLWSTIQTFHYPATKYTSLLAIHGIGTILGGFVAPMAIRSLNKHITMIPLYVGIRFLSILVLINLAWVPSFYLAWGLLMLGGVPETMASVCFFTLLRTHLSNEEQGDIHAFIFPIRQFCMLCGSLLAITYTGSYLSLKGFWLLATGIALVFTLLPLLLLRKYNKQIS